MRCFPTILVLSLLLGSPALGQIDIQRLDGPAADQEFGTSVTGVGDINLDGFDDFAVGSSAADPISGVDAGQVWVYSGADATLMGTYSGDSAFDSFGYAIAGAGDVNGDGYPDVIVGAPRDDNAGDS